MIRTPEINIGKCAVKQAPTSRLPLCSAKPPGYLCLRLNKFKTRPNTQNCFRDRAELLTKDPALSGWDRARAYRFDIIELVVEVGKYKAVEAGG